MTDGFSVHGEIEAQLVGHAHRPLVVEGADQHRGLFPKLIERDGCAAANHVRFPVLREEAGDVQQRVHIAHGVVALPMGMTSLNGIISLKPPAHRKATSSRGRKPAC